MLLDQGEVSEACTLVEPALESLRRSLSQEDWKIASVECVWGGCLAALGRHEEAAPLLERSYAALLEAKGETSIYTRQAKARMERLP